MTEKNKKTEKKIICMDCKVETHDFYSIQTNRGDVEKCANCYELWIIRSTRYNQTDKNRPTTEDSSKLSEQS